MKHSEGSEVARLRAQIDAEFQAAERAMTGMAEGAARHAFITKRLETMHGYVKEAKDTLSAEDAALVIGTIGEKG